MKIDVVTFTGVDETAKLADLVKLSEQYECIEWGFLISPSRQGHEPRYPDLDWIRKAAEKLGKERCAAHLCGRAAREIFDGERSWLSRWGGLFSRVQFNGFSDHCMRSDVISNLVQAMAYPQCDYIVQVASGDAMQKAEWLGKQIFNVAALWDTSGGRGISPDKWPKPSSSILTGYAGGIGPDNIEQVLWTLHHTPGSHTWIDMESQLRDEHDRFSIDKCRNVVEKAVADAQEH